MPNLPYISPELVREYHREVSTQASPATTKRKMAALKKFFGWAHAAGHIPENPIEQLKIPTQPQAEVIPSKPKLKPISLLKLAIPAIMVVFLFLLARKVKLPIPFLPAPAKETALVTKTPAPTATPVVVEKPIDKGALIAEVKEELLKLVGETLEWASYEAGNLLIGGAPVSSISLSTGDTTDGDITINPDGSGVAHFLFEGSGENFLNAQAPNLTSGSLYYGVVTNNALGYDLIRLQSGSNPITRFSVDAQGNVEAGGDLNAQGDISTDDTTRLTETGALTNITGFDQDSGNFSITQSAGETASIVKKDSALSDLLTLTLDERGKGNSIYSTLTLKRYDGAVEGAALFVDEGNAIFDGQVRLGRFSSSPSPIGSASIFYNTTDNLIYYYDGSAWQSLGTAVVTPFSLISSGTNTTAAMVVGSGASLTFSGTGTITASELTCTGCVANSELANSAITFAGDTGSSATSLGGTRTIAGGEGIDTSESAGTITIAGEDASTTNKGIASFDANFFTVTIGNVTLKDDSLDFGQFKDALTLDASTDIALGALTLSTSGTGALNFASTGQVTFAGNVDATAGLDVTGASLTVGTGYSWTTGGVITAATDETINGIDISVGTVSDVVSFALATAGNTWSSAGDLTISGNLDVNGTTNDIAGTLNLSGNTLTSNGDLTINPTGGQVLLFDTDTLIIGGHPGNVAYNVIANSGQAPSQAAISSDNDLYIGGELEVTGTIYGNVSGTINPGFTTGSVIFQGPSGLAQDNANFFWDDTNNLLGVGTNSPTSKLHVTGAVTGKALAIFDETGDQDIFTASASGTTRARITNAGNLYLTGTLNTISGNLTIDSAGGTTTISDNLAVTGTSDLQGAVANSTGNLNLNDNTDITGNLDVSGTLTSGTANAFTVDATGNITTAGDLAVNGGDITTTATTFNLVNTTATTLNIGSAATSLSLGASTGTTTINNATLAVTGVLDVNGAGTSDIAGTLNLSGNTLTSTGDLIINAGGGDVASDDRWTVGSQTPGVAKLTVTGAETGKALVIFDETGDQNILTASASGVTKANLDRSGNLAIEGALSDLSDVNLQVSDNLIPSADNTYDLGSATNRWQDAYIVNLQATQTDIAGTTSETFTLDTDNTGGNLSLIFGTTNNERLTWNATSSQFDLTDDLNITGNLTASGVLDINGSGTSDIAGTLNLSGNNLTATGDLIINTGGDDIASDDRLTVGTQTPGVAQLTVSGTQIGKALVIFNDTGTDQNILTASASGTTRLILSNAGNLSISGDLTVTGNDIAGSAGAVVAFSGTNTSLAADLTVVGGGITGANSEAISLGETDNQITFTSGAATRAQIDTSGNFGVEGSLYDITDATLTVNDALSVSGTLTLTGVISDSDSDVQIADNLDPAADATYDLGDTTTSWKDLYLTGQICFDDTDCASSTSGFSGPWTYSAPYLYPDASATRVALGTTTTAEMISEFYVTRTLSDGALGKALAIFNQTESQDILTASASGTPRVTITNAGNLQFHQAASITTTTGNLTLDSTGGTTQVSDNLVVTGASDLQGAVSDSNSDLQLNDNVDITGNLYDSDSALTVNDDLTVTGTTGAAFSGIGAGVSFSGTGTHSISASAGTLSLGAVTLAGNMTVAQDIDIVPAGTTGTNDIGSSGVPFDNIYAVALFQNGNAVCDASGANCPTGGNAGPWDTSGGIVYLDTTSNLVSIGDTTTVHKLEVEGAVTGKALVSLWEKGDQDILVASNSAAPGTNVFRITNAGNIYLTGTLNTTTGNLTLDSAGGTTTVSDNFIVTGTSDLRGNISNSTGTLVLDDSVDIGSSANGINVDTAGNISDINGDLILNDQTLIGSATTGIQITTAGAISDLNANLVLDDTTDIGSGTTGIRIATTGEVSDIDGSILVADTILPSTTDTYDLGSSSSIWNEVFTNIICFDGASDCITNSNSAGPWTLSSPYLYPDSSLYQVGIGTTTTAEMISQLYVTRTLSDGALGKALAIFNQTESQDILTASASGTPRVTITNAGNLQFHQAASITTTTGNLTLDSTGGTTQVSDNLVVTGTSDLQGAVSDSLGDLELSDQVVIGTPGSGLLIATSGTVSDQDANVTIADTVDLGSASVGIRVDATDGVITDIDDTSVQIDDDIQFVGAQAITTSAGDLTLNSAANTVLADATIQLSGTNPTISATATNSTLSVAANGTGTLTLQSGATGNIQFFSSSNTLTSGGNLTIAGDATINGGDITTASVDLNINPGGGDVTIPARATVGSATAGIGKLNVTGAEIGKALAIFDETGDQNILTASASGTTVANLTRTGDLELRGQGDLRLYDTDNSNYTGFQSPALSSNLLMTLPSTAGAAGYALTTDGAGTLSWTDISTGGSAGPWTLSDPYVYPDSANYQVGIGTTSTGDIISKLYVSNTGTLTGKAVAVFNQTENQDILTASASGTTRIYLTNAGQIVLPTTGSTGGVLLGGDANLYRGGANILTTDDIFNAVTALQTGGTLEALRNFSVPQRFYISTANDANVPVLYVDSNGQITINAQGTQAVRFNFDKGTGGVIFGSGAASTAASITSAGDLNLTGGDITGQNSISLDLGEANSTAGTLTGHLFPATTDTYDLGSSSLIWNEVFANIVCFDGASDCITNSNAAGPWTLSSPYLYPDSSNYRVGMGTTTTADMISQLYVTRTLADGALGKALAIFNQTESQDILTASASGTTRMVVSNTGNLGIEGNIYDITDSALTVNDDLKVAGNDIVDSGDVTRITLGATTTLTNTTTTLSGTTTLTASSLATIDTAASLTIDATSLTLGGSATIYGGTAASGTLTLVSTSDTTKGNIQFFSSSNTLSSAGNLTIAGVLDVNGGGTSDIAGTLNLSGNSLTSTADLTIDSGGGQVIFSDTDTLNIGGLTNVAYNAFANAADASDEAAISADNDVYIGGDLEVDGTIYGTVVGTVPWSEIDNPTANLTLAHAQYATTFNWDMATDAAFDAWTSTITNDLVTDTTTQRLLVLKNADDALTTGTTERLLVLDNADANEAVTTALEILASSTGTITTAIDVSDAEIGTALAFGANDIDGTNFDVTGSTGNVTTAGDIAVNGGDITSTSTTLTLGGSIVTLNCSDCIDFDDLEDTLDLDTALTLNQSTNAWTQNFTGTTGTGLTYNANSLTSGSGTSLSSTQGTTSSLFTGDLANLSFSKTYNGGVGSETGNTLDVSRSITRDISVAGDLAVSGALATISDTAATSGAGTGTLTHSADVVRIAQNYTSNTGAALNVTSAGGATGFALRVNDDGTFTDTTPFVVDNSGNVGIGDTSPDTKLEVLSTTEQLRLTNVDDTTDARFTISATGDLTIDLLGSGTTDQLILGDTDTLNIGGSGSTEVAYNVIGDSTTGASANMNSDDDLYIEGDLEVDGTIYGSVSGSAGSVKWNAITAPDGNLSLSHGTNTTTFDSTATTGTFFTMSTNSLTSGTNLSLSSTSNNYTTGSLLTASLTQSAATGTSVSGNIANLAFSPTYSTAITTPAISGNILDVSRTATTNNLFASTLTVSGALASFSDSATQTTGTLTSTADVIRIAQNYTSNTGSALNVTSGGGSTGFALRVNDDGTFTDTTPFVVDNAGNVGIGTTGPSELLDVAGDIRSTTGTLQVGNSANVAYNRIGTGTATGGNIGDASDFFVSDSLQVVGRLYTTVLDGLSGTVSVQNGVWDFGGGARLGISGTCGSCWPFGITSTVSGNVGAALIQPTLNTTGAGQTQYGQYINITNSPTDANTLYGLRIAVTDSGTLANTVTGLYVDATTANANDTTYAAVFQGGNVGIGDTTPLATLTVGSGDLFQVAGATGNITTSGDLAVNGGDITTTATTLNIDVANTGTINFRDGTNALAAVKDQGDYVFWNLKGKSTTGNPATCAEGDIYYNAFDNTVYVCHETNTWEQLDGGGSGSSLWSALLDPTADLTLAMAAYNSIFNWDPGADSAATNWTITTQGEDTTGTGDQDQVLLALSQTSNAVNVDEAADALLTFANNDADDPVENAIRFDAGAAGTDFTYGINFDAASIGTAEIVLQGGERIQNVTDGTITLEDDGGNDLAQFIDQGTTGRLAVSDSLQVGGLTTVAYSRFGTAATGHGLTLSSDVLVGGKLEVDGTLFLDSTTTIANSAGTATVLFAADPTTTANTLTAASYLVENSANVGLAALIVNQQKGGDLFTASASGTTKFKIANNGNVTIDGSGTMLTVGGGTGKIDVGTVDPVYSIGDKKYATYMAGMVGVKEETTGNITTSQYIPGLGYRTTIDFKAEPEGSDLWLFARATDIKDNIDKMVVLLSPSDNTRTWYEIDKDNYTLAIYSSRPTNISYRLTAPRFDYAQWSNYNDNPEAVGFKVEDSPLSATGDAQETNVLSLSDFVIVKEVPETIYKVYQTISDGSKIAVEEFGAFVNLVAGNIKAGSVVAKEVTTDAFNSFQGTIDNLLITSGLVSPSVKTALISPLPDEANVAVQIGNENVDSGFGKLVVENTQGEEVATIDTSGNATFSGTLAAEEVKTNEVVAGKIFADEIVARSGYFAETNTASISGISREEIEKILKEVEGDQQILASASSWNINTATDSASLEELAVSNLYVTEQAAMCSLSVSSSFMVGGDLVFQSAMNNQPSTINTLSSPLSIQSLALAPIEIMAGKVKIDTNGDVTIFGNLYVAGQIESSGLTLKENGFGELLKLQDASGNRVAIVTASGSAEFKEVTAEKFIIAGANNAPLLADVNGEIQTNATVGSAVIPAGIAEITIINPNISDYTLVYVTPTSSTLNNVLYVKAKGLGFFTVGFTLPLESDVTFNWWVITVNE